MDIDRNKVVLVLPSLDVFPSYIEALREGFVSGDAAPLSDEKIDALLVNPEKTIHDINYSEETTVTAPDGSRHPRVPMATYWLCHQSLFMGAFSFRPQLSELLEHFGGHVGYGIRPSLQGCGYATLGLQLMREKAASAKIERLLVTCKPANQASRKVILKNGGEYIDTLDDPYGYGPTQRYWVPVEI